jgi:hypothetical protein
MDEFVNSHKYGDEEIEKGVDGEGEMKGVHHYHAHNEDCSEMPGENDHILHRYPHNDQEKDKEDEGEHSYSKNDMEDEEKAEHEGKYPGFVRTIR